MAQLPLYYKNGKPVGPPTPRRWKEVYLLFIVFVGFIIMIAGVLWFVPPVEDDEWRSTYYGFNPSAVTDVAGMPYRPTLESLVPSENEKLPQQDEEKLRAPQPPHLLEGGKTLLKEETMDPAQKEPNPKLGVVEPHDGNGDIRNGNGDTRNGNGNEVHQNESEKQVQETVVSKLSEGDVVSKFSEGDVTTEERREKVKQMAKHSWDAYVQHAWGDNELRPITKRGHSPVIFGKSRMGATLVDSLDTLYIMGLTEEFNRGKEWVRQSFSLNDVKEVSVFEVNIRFIGGLLSAYALSKDEVFKEKAVEIADKILPAFNTPTGIPKALVNLQTGALKNWGWASGGSSVLAEFGSLHLEFQYLTYLTGNPIYLEKVSHIRSRLQSLPKQDGLYPNFLNPTTGNWGTRHVSLGALGDSFYEYLLKSWLMTNKDDTEARDMYYDTINAMEKHMFKKTADHLTYVTDLRNGRSDGKMQHLTCFAGGMLGLGAVHAVNGQSEHYMDLAKEVAKTCHESYQRSATKLGPEAFRFDANGKISSRSNEKMYLLRPETVETYFVLWRLTHDQKYRDWGWEVVEALEEHCRIDSGGYSGIRDVYNPSSSKDDVMQSFFVAETLKYLYLLYTDDSVIPLDSWVFNTEAHPLPFIPRIPTPEPVENPVLSK